MRQVVLDTETTGLEPALGHRIIEIGVVEILNRRLTGKNFHTYLNPDREIDSGALAVHGITQAFLADKPRFPEVLNDFLAFIHDAEIIIHNAPFDMGFLRKETQKNLEHWKVTDTLSMARKLHPGQKNNLDALCKRYSVDNSDRNLHGALVDAKILALVYLAMTGGQDSLFDVSAEASEKTKANIPIKILANNPIRVIKASPEEILAHKKYRETLCHSD
ncbi:MAG: DNA polymerase III subunit epsilon [Gammaproteobacteria bacterium]